MVDETKTYKRIFYGPPTRAGNRKVYGSMVANPHVAIPVTEIGTLMETPNEPQRNRKPSTIPATPARVQCGCTCRCRNKRVCNDQPY